MVDFRRGITQSANDGDDIYTARIVNFTVVDIVVNGAKQVSLLLVVDGLKRVDKVTAATGLHLNKNNKVILLGNDINVTVLGMPVAL